MTGTHDDSLIIRTCHEIAVHALHSRASDNLLRIRATLPQLKLANSSLNFIDLLTAVQIRKSPLNPRPQLKNALKSKGGGDTSDQKR